MRSRRRVAALLAAAVLLVGVMLATATPTSYDAPAFVANPADHIDTLVGTGTGGQTVGEINNFPGASVPFGMVQYSPDTVDNYAAHDYANGQATGFSMTHASVGYAAFGDISMLPTTTPIGSEPWGCRLGVAPL
jgi:putative alpha-1,2-mannosidase